MRRKDAIELGVTVALGIILLVVSLSLARRPKVRQEPGSPGPLSPATSVARVQGQVQGHKLHPRKVEGDKFMNRFNLVTAVLPLERNPFGVGQEGPQDAKAVLVLDGIMWSAEKPTAIIGSGFYKEGDTIDRFKVVKIHPTKVVLQDGGSEFELRLNQNTN